jgi:hypothetical protein
MISFRCPKCNNSNNVEDYAAGTSVPCASCGNICTVPQQQTTTVNVQVVSPVRGTSVLGIVSIVFGAVALLSAWIPFIGCVGVPLAIVGCILGVLGLVLALSGKKSGIGLPIAGLAISAAAIILVFVVTGGTAKFIGNVANSTMYSTAKSEVDFAAARIEQYRADNGKYPASLSDVYKAPERVPVDPWGHDLNYERTDDGFRVWSNGPDGKSGTADDISKSGDKSSGQLETKPEAE